jgi:hypothetical protein
MLLLSQMLGRTPATPSFSRLRGGRSCAALLAAALLCAGLGLARTPISTSTGFRGDGPAADSEAAAPPAIVIGFMGGKVAHDDATRNELIISNRLRTAYPRGVYFEVFENRRLEDAHQKILQLLGASPAHALSPEEKRNARIILYGHSWGASAVITVANELQQDGIPVLLTIQVDSIEKNGQDDSVIPSNVARAINFYQPDGILHGRQEIRAADPGRTQILGNFRFTYKEAPQECRPYPWFERLLIKTHIAIECDPVLWKRIEGLIRDTLDQPAKESAAG